MAAFSVRRPPDGLTIQQMVAEINPAGETGMRVALPEANA